MIVADMIDAKKVRFLLPIFEDDFPERGMTAWLTGVEWDTKDACYKLYFDFSEFEDINQKYFRESYYPNIHTAKVDPTGQRRLYTAVEAGWYKPKYSTGFSATVDGAMDGACLDTRDDTMFAMTITHYLKEVE